jgi:hypothetical protein
MSKLSTVALKNERIKKQQQKKPQYTASSMISETGTREMGWSKPAGSRGLESPVEARRA